jgi:hypothetical protein
MSDINKKVSVDLVADATKFRNEFKKVTKDAQDLGKNQANLRKAGIKEDKNLQKLTKDFLKFNKNENQQALRHEKQLASVLKQKSNILRDLHKAGKANSEEFKKEQKALKETAALYSDIKRSRTQAFGKDSKSSTTVTKAGLLGAAGAVGIVAAAVGGAIIGAVKGRITDAIDAANEYNSAAIDSLGDKNFGQGARSKVRGAGNLAGFNAIESMKQAGLVARQTGFAGDAGTSLQLSRAAMIDQGQSAGFMGMQARGGILNMAAKREQEKIIAAGFASGMQRGRMGEFLTGVTALSEKAQSRTAGNVGAGGYADLLAAFGKSKMSGLQGARGAQVLQQLEQGVMAPGAGEAGQALVLRSKGFGTPGGNTDYYSALKRQQQGFAGDRGAGELKSFIDQLQVEFGANSQAAALAGSNTTGVSLDIMEKVIKLVNGFSGDSKELKKQIGELTKGSLPLEEQVRDILNDKIAESLKMQNEITSTLVRQGQDLLPISLELKDLINKIVTSLTDDAIPVLQAIRNILIDSYNFFNRDKAYSEIASQGKVDIDRAKALFGDDPNRLREYADLSIKMIDKKIAETQGSGGLFGKDDSFINSLRQQKNSFLELKDEAANSLGLYDNKPKDSPRGGSFSITPKELEDAVARGTARGQKESTSPNVTVNNRPTIIASDNTQVQFR